MNLKQSIGSQIKALRIVAGLNQSGLANRIGVSKQYISGVEAGKETLSLEQVEKFAAALDAALMVTLHPNNGTTLKKMKTVFSNALAAVNVAEAMSKMSEENQKVD